MIKYIEAKDIKFPFYKSSLAQIDKLKIELNLLKSEFEKMSSEGEELTSYDEKLKDDEREIPIGSRVLVKRPNRNVTEGRIWGKKNYGNIYEVNKKGLKNYENIRRNELINLSIGVFDELERDIWIAEKNITNLGVLLSIGKLPQYLTKNSFYIIEIAMVLPYSELFDIVYFVLSDNLQSNTFLAPTKVTNTGFYQIEVSDGEILDIRPSSKTAFELSYSEKM
ncbi:MAG: hypothetical protein ACTHJ5_15705 [Ilyomonas sp.]